MRVFAALPLGVHYFNAHIVGWIARDIVRYRTKVVKDNIDKAFPELDDKARRKIYKDFYLHFGQIVCETIWFGGSKEKRIHKSRIMRILNPEEVARQHGNTNGIVVLCSHGGNWELYGGLPFYNYTDIDMQLTYDNAAVVYRKLKSPLWNEIFEENRLFCTTGYQHYIESSGILRHILQNKGKSMFYFMISDQWPYFKAPSYIEVDFMGRHTRTMSGGASVAHKYSMSVCYLSITRRQGGRKYDLEFKPICDDASKMPVQEIMDRYYRFIEDDIRKDPGGYLWSHKRWKKLN